MLLPCENENAVTQWVKWLLLLLLCGEPQTPFEDWLLNAQVQKHYVWGSALQLFMAMPLQYPMA